MAELNPLYHHNSETFFATFFSVLRRCSGEIFYLLHQPPVAAW